MSRAHALRDARRALLAGLCCAVSLACSRARPPEPASPAPAASPAASSDPEALALIAKLEQRLLASSAFRLEARVQMTGAVELGLSGKLLLKPENVVSMEFSGTQGGKPVTVFLTSDGKNTKGGPRNHSFEQGTPEALRRNMLIAFAHKGLSQGIMDLFAGSVPNAGEKGAADRIRMAGLALGGRVKMAEREVQAVNFDVLIDDELTAQGTLWIAADTALPVQRAIYVRRPRELIVIERYEVLQLDAAR